VTARGYCLSKVEMACVGLLFALTSLPAFFKDAS
jgi:hypothetical protein